MKSFAAKRRASDIAALLVHSRFVPSLASSDAVRRARSVEHLSHELALSSSLGADAYVIHAGAYSVDSSLEAGVALFVDSVRRSVAAASFTAPLLLENVPGGGRRMGGSLEDLAVLQESFGSSLSLGFCLDTAHAHAAGYDCSTAAGALAFEARAKSLLGPGAVRAFHLNDTRAILGSHREHHEHWGRGLLGSEGLRALLSLPEHAATPGILETPKDGAGADRENLSYAERLVQS